VKKDQVYAVVDIESTGGSIGKGERMIQFACVLVSNGQIIERFDTYVNPLKQVPQRIQELTGIQPKQLKSAPLFEDLAEFIYDLLEDTIFVAHNVAFDFRFLNEELINAGMAPLTIPAIDTVELAQILFPTADSYNLQELVDWLGYELDQPHHALFDAEATAYLLQKLSQKVKELPLVTLEKLVDFSVYCTAETSHFFKHALEDLKENPKDLPESLMVVEGLALKQATSITDAYNYREEKVFPQTKDEKNDLYQNKLMYREEQAKMMDAIYTYMQADETSEELAIEAAPGSGKTIGYLLPAVYTGTPSSPIVISTYTTLLQKQLVEETIPFLNDLGPFDLSVALVKSRRHYLSLEIFEQKLKQVSSQEVEAFFCMRILVWLTETETGDLEELGAAGHDTHDFWNEIRSRKQSKIKKNSKWQKLEFYTKAKKRVEKASIIVTNHAFLAHELQNEEKVLPEFKQLIIDEAHHWPQMLQEASIERASNGQFKNLFAQLGTQQAEGTLLAQFTKFIPKKLVKKYQIDSIEATMRLIEEEWESILTNWLNDLATESGTEEGNWQEKTIDVSKQTVRHKKQLKQLNGLLGDLLFVGNHMVENCVKESKQLTVIERGYVNNFFETLEKLSDWKQALKSIFSQSEGIKLSWAEFHRKNPLSTLSFQSISTKKYRQLNRRIHQLSHVIYTSSTLSVNGSLSYFKEQIEHQEVTYLQLKEPFDYGKQARIFVPSNGSIQPFKDDVRYVESLAQSIEQLTKGIDENCLVLFRSIETLHSVYRILSQQRSLVNRAILAQHVNGTRNKLLKQFKQSENALLLGTDTFWEGIDLPGEALRMVIVTRLPFDSPDKPLVKWRHQQLEKEGENPFVRDLLPQAVLKMKQGFGRLIRSNQDKGVCIILDDRLLTASYGKVFKAGFPETVAIEEYSFDEIRREIEVFLKSSL
jgi:ATP-dependent DNA helicase DinG